MESNLSKTITAGIKETPKKRACAGLGVRAQMLPWSMGNCGGQAALQHLGMQQWFQWVSWGSAMGSSGVPVISWGSWISLPTGERGSGGCTFPALLPHRPGRGLASRFWKAEELSAKACAGAFPCRSWSSRWQTGPTT